MICSSTVQPRHMAEANGLQHLPRHILLFFTHFQCCTLPQCLSAYLCCCSVAHFHSVCLNTYVVHHVCWICEDPRHLSASTACIHAQVKSRVSNCFVSKCQILGPHVCCAANTLFLFKKQLPRSDHGPTSIQCAQCHLHRTSIKHG